MDKFVDFRNELLRNEVHYIDNDGVKPYLVIENPIHIFSFAGFLKSHNSIFSSDNSFRKILFRGECDLYDQVPSLFRGENINENIILNRLKAYRALIKELPEKINSSERFKSKLIGAILQHYGIRTPWIDVVDNLHTALWFATHKFNRDIGGYEQRKAGCFGYVTFIASADESSGEELDFNDFRETSSSAHLRPIVQHGAGLTKKQTDDEIKDKFCLNNWVVGRVKFRIDQYWSSSCATCCEKILFPDEKYDNTYKIFKYHGLDNLIEEIEKRYNLNKNELGRLTLPRF